MHAERKLLSSVCFAMAATSSGTTPASITAPWTLAAVSAACSPLWVVIMFASAPTAVHDGSNRVIACTSRPTAPATKSSLWHLLLIQHMALHVELWTCFSCDCAFITSTSTPATLVLKNSGYYVCFIAMHTSKSIAASCT